MQPQSMDAKSMREEIHGVCNGLRRVERTLADLCRSQQKLTAALTDMRASPSTNGISSASTLAIGEMNSGITAANTLEMNANVEEGHSLKEAAHRSGNTSPGDKTTSPHAAASMIARNVPGSEIEPTATLNDAGVGSAAVGYNGGYISGANGTSVYESTVGARYPSSYRKASTQETGFVASTLPAHWPKRMKLNEGLQGAKSAALATADRMSSGPPLVLSMKALTFKSDADVEEKKRAWVLHPDSKRAALLELLSSGFVVYELFVTPFVVAWDVQRVGWLNVMYWCSAVYWVIDIVGSFFTGFYSRGEVILSQGAIRRRYFRGWFLPDLLLVLCDMANIIANLLGMRGGYMLRLLRLSRLCRVVSLAKLSRLFIRLEDHMQSHESAEMIAVGAKLGRIVVIILSANHLLACIWMLIGRIGHADTGVRWLDTAVLYDPTSEIVLEYSKDLSMVYQYSLSFHWALAQLTLGASDVTAQNSLEMIYTIVCITLGLLMGTSLISVFSAEMVEVQLSSRQKDAVHKQLYHFLKHHRIDNGFSRRVRAMVLERLKKSPPVAAQDVHSLRLLPNYLQMDLHFRICGRSLLTHPIFSIWRSFSANSVLRFCMDAVQLIETRPNDEVFGGGKRAENAYHVRTGHGVYEQDPESAPVIDSTSTKVHESKWLAEAALWLDWTHVGTFRVSVQAEVLVISVDGIPSVLQQNVVLQEITVAYCRAYHARVIASFPPMSEFPTDLGVRDCDFEDILCEMDRNLVEAVGLQALRQAAAAPSHTSYEAALQGLGKRSALVQLEADYKNKHCRLYLTGDDTVRCVAANVGLRVNNSSGHVLMHVANVSSNGKFHFHVSIPMARQVVGETSTDTALRLIEKRLHPFKASLQAPPWVRRVDKKDDTGLTASRKSRFISLATMNVVLQMDYLEDPRDLEGRIVDSSSIATAHCRKDSSRMDLGAMLSLAGPGAAVNQRWSAAFSWLSSRTAWDLSASNSHHSSTHLNSGHHTYTSARHTFSTGASRNASSTSESGADGAVGIRSIFVIDHHDEEANLGLYTWVAEAEFDYFSNGHGRSELITFASSLEFDEITLAGSAQGDSDIFAAGASLTARPSAQIAARWSQNSPVGAASLSSPPKSPTVPERRFSNHSSPMEVENSLDVEVVQHRAITFRSVASVDQRSNSSAPSETSDCPPSLVDMNPSSGKQTFFPPSPEDAASASAVSKYKYHQTL